MTNNIQGNSHKVNRADFSAETLQARREWHDIFKVMKGKKLQPRLLYRQGSQSDSMEKSKALQTSKS